MKIFSDKMEIKKAEKICINPRNLCLLLMIALAFSACKNPQNKPDENATDTLAMAETPAFNADSAYAYTAAQCAFGPRTMNSAAHDKCGDYIVAKFKQFGAQVTEQRTDVVGYDGTILKCRNIIASYAPEKAERVLICGHWDSRPWADNDPDPANHRKPVLAANDAASDVAVMLEMARLVQQQAPQVGVDFICFDAEDYGTPQWADTGDQDADTWCLGSTYWARNTHVANYRPRFGILLDMVGGKGATFAQEGFSLRNANGVVKNVWNTAEQLGLGHYFPKAQGGFITDDHVPVNELANIPCIDIIAYYPNCPQSGFGPTWHTVSDTMENIDKDVLGAVGRVVMQVVYNENL